MSIIELNNDELRIIIDPSHGASTLAFDAKVNDQWLPIMPDTRMPTSGLEYSNFLMIPYSNRIENGIFSFFDQSYKLKNGDNHAIHGDVRNRPWEIKEVTSYSLHCTFDSQQHTNVNWPWDFSVDAFFILNGSTMEMKLSLTNSSKTHMPAGMGWHPYFSRHLTKKGEPVLLHFSLEGCYPDQYGTRIPSGPLETLSPDQNFHPERELAPENALDTCYYGFNSGTITWPKSNIQLRLEANDNCKHLVVYNPSNVDYFAIEPVTNANNGFNLFASDDPTSGTHILSPGTLLEATCTLKVEPFSC